MSKATLPRVRVPNGHSYCWAERSFTHARCTLPIGHGGMHWHAYSRTSW